MLVILLDLKIKIQSCVRTVVKFIARNASKTRLIRIKMERVTSVGIVVKVKNLMNFVIMTCELLKRKFGSNTEQ